MIFSLSILTVLSLIFAKLFEKARLPGLIGMILAGICIGNFSRQYFITITDNQEFEHFEWIFVTQNVFEISPELRNLALIIILFRAGLGISRENLNKIGMPALKMSLIPGLFEALVVMISAHYFLNLSFKETSLLAFVIAAVSPAVIVPAMLRLKEKGVGNINDVPTLVLASASIDDLVAITLFGVCLSFNLDAGNNSIAVALIKTPVMIITAIIIGLLLGSFIVKLNRMIQLRSTYKLIFLLILGIFLFHYEKFSPLPFSSLLSVMVMAYQIREKDKAFSEVLSKKFNSLWGFAELLLFSLIGAEVDVYLAFEIGSWGLVIFVLGLLGRSAGVLISLLGSIFNKKERIFCVIAYLPKATVQAAIGGVALAAGIASGNLILSMAVLSILVTAPVGSIAIRIWAEKLLA